jgi:hypothetical protein
MGDAPDIALESPKCINNMSKEVNLKGSVTVKALFANKPETEGWEAAKKRLVMASINGLSLGGNREILRDVCTKLSRGDIERAIPTSVKSAITNQQKRRLSQVGTRSRGDFLREIRTETKGLTSTMTHVERDDISISTQVKKEFAGIESIREPNQEQEPASPLTPRRRGSLIFASKSSPETSPRTKSRRSSLFSKKSTNIVNAIEKQCDPITMQGPLAKKASGLLNNDKWQTRYFVISGHSMQYYDSLELFKTQRHKPKGVLDLGELQSCKRVGESLISLNFGEDESNLRAPSYESAMRWLYALKKTAGICTKPQPKSSPSAHSPSSLLARSGNFAPIYCTRFSTIHLPAPNQP